MNQFRSNYFKFNGIDSEAYGYKMIEVGNSNNNEVILGLNRSINSSEGTSDLDVFKGVKNEYHNIIIQLTKTEGNKLLKFSEKDLSFINKWLFLNKFSSLEVENGLVYFVIFKSIKGRFEAGGAVLTLEIQMLPHAYSPIRVVHAVVNGEKIIEIINNSTVNETVPIDFRVRMNVSRELN